MSKFGLQIDTNYKSLTEQANNLRGTMRRTVHQPDRRATTRTLFLIGLLTLVIVGGGAIGLSY